MKRYFVNQQTGRARVDEGEPREGEIVKPFGQEGPMREADFAPEDDEDDEDDEDSELDSL
jgi:hypothetical protein